VFGEIQAKVAMYILQIQYGSGIYF